MTERERRRTRKVAHVVRDRRRCPGCVEMDPHDGDLEGHDHGGSGVEAKTLGGVMTVWPVRSAGGCVS